MLTNDQIDLIRGSAERMSEASFAATNAFYSNLFKAAPGVRSLFPEDMFEQNEKLWDSIVMVVRSADSFDHIIDALKALGGRHVAYGAQPEHYTLVAEVLVETIATLMAQDWTPDHQSAWEAALNAVCQTMLEGAANVAK